VGLKVGVGLVRSRKAELIDFSVSIIRYVQAIRAYGYPFRIVKPAAGAQKTPRG